MSKESQTIALRAFHQDLANHRSFGQIGFSRRGQGHKKKFVPKSGHTFLYARKNFDESNVLKEIQEVFFADFLRVQQKCPEQRHC